MAMTHETIPSTAFDDLLLIFGDRSGAGLRTLVLDRRVVGIGVTSPSLKGTIDLQDPERWHALIVADQEHAYEDIEGFARVFRTWCTPPKPTVLHPTPDLSKVKGAARCVDIVKSLYDSTQAMPHVNSIDESLVHSWRTELRSLGEDPRAVVDDPWFSHLFLSPSAGELPLAQPYTVLDLRTPDVPCVAARNIVTSVLDRLIARTARHAPGEITVYVLEGPDLRDVIERLEERIDPDDGPNVRVVWVDQVDAGGFAYEMTGEPTPAESDNDNTRLYRMFSSLMDERHRPAFVKGIMYGYPAFCVLQSEHEAAENGEKLPTDVTFLRHAGIVLGTSSPLIELFDDG